MSAAVCSCCLRSADQPLLVIPKRELRGNYTFSGTASKPSGKLTVLTQSEMFYIKFYMSIILLWFVFSHVCVQHFGKQFFFFSSSFF